MTPEPLPSSHAGPEPLPSSLAQVQLQGDDNTLRNALDTLASSCMQLAELLSSKQSQGSRETAEGLNALVAGNGKKKSKVGLNKVYHLALVLTLL